MTKIQKILSRIYPHTSYSRKLQMIAVVFVTFLASNYASFCPGSGFLVDGGQGRVFYEGK